MLLRVHNTTTSVSDQTPEEDKWLRRQLKFTDANQMRINLFWGDNFPTGLVPLVRKQAAVDSVNVDVADLRGPMPAHGDPADLALPPFGLRDYQIEAIAAFLTGGVGLIPHPLDGRGVIWIPTGGGKTYLTVGLVSLMPANWVFLVHRGHLANDTKERYERMTGERCGWIGDGRWDPRPGFTVATMQTLYANMGTARYQKLVDATEALAGDEIHTGAAKTFSSVIGSFLNARVRVGLSGTPLDRSDKRSLVAVGCIGPVVYRIKAETLIAAKAIVPPTINIIPCWQPEPQAEDWTSVYDELVVNSKHRNSAVLKALELAEKPGILFVRSVKHGDWLAKQAREMGLRVEYVSGKSSLEQRKRACQRTTRGELDYIVSTTVFTEGVDIPCLRSAILAAGGKAWINTLQSVGRIVRTSEGKDGAEIWDIGDCGAWLSKHSQSRIRACKREGYKVVVRPDVHHREPQ